jgi:hypothetical protein
MGIGWFLFYLRNMVRKILTKKCKTVTSVTVLGLKWVLCAKMGGIALKHNARISKEN